MKKIMVTIFIWIITIYSIRYSDAKEVDSYVTEEDVKIFHKQGYLLKKGCLEKKIMAELNDKVEQVLIKSFNEIERNTNLSIDSEKNIFINDAKVIYKKTDDSTSILRINGVGGFDPYLLQTLSSPRILHTFFSLLGTNDIEHLICQLHPKLPFDQVSFNAHRVIFFRKSFDPDWQDILGNGSWVICIIPIDRMGKENGGLWIDKASFIAEDKKEDIFWIEAEPGDLLFIHPLILHGSGPNNSSFSRRTLLTGFCAFGANHKAYPGAFVNRRFTLLNNEEISMTLSPWAELNVIGEGSGH
jgi:hypothetical protein